MSDTLDLTGLAEKRNRKGKLFYEDLSGNIVAKVCSKCSSAKLVDEFGKQSSGFLGKRAICLVCHNGEGRKWKNENSQRRKETHKKYYEENKDKIQKYNQEYRQINREKIDKYNRRYREENKEKRQEYNKMYRDKFKSKVLESGRRYREDNKEKRRKYNQFWERENREKARLKVVRRRAIKANLPDNFGIIESESTLKVFKDSCALTGESTNRTWDHAIPLNSGHGGTTYGNMYPLRGDLNSSKGDRNIFEWFKANRQRFNLSQAKFDALIDWLAETNDMTVEEYTAYVYECHGEKLKEA